MRGPLAATSSRSRTSLFYSIVCQTIRVLSAISRSSRCSRSPGWPIPTAFVVKNSPECVRQHGRLHQRPLTIVPTEFEQPDMIRLIEHGSGASAIALVYHDVRKRIVGGKPHLVGELVLRSSTP